MPTHALPGVSINAPWPRFSAISKVSVSGEYKHLNAGFKRPKSQITIEIQNISGGVNGGIALWRKKKGGGILRACTHFAGGWGSLLYFGRAFWHGLTEHKLLFRRGGAIKLNAIIWQLGKTAVQKKPVLGCSGLFLLCSVRGLLQGLAYNNVFSLIALVVRWVKALKTIAYVD